MNEFSVQFFSKDPKVKAGKGWGREGGSTV